MFSNRILSGLLICVLLAAIAAGWRVHVSNRERATSEFLDHQLHTADVLAATLQAELTGTARALRVTAWSVARESDDRARRALLEQQLPCTEVPCFAGLAVYGSGDDPLLVAGRPPGLNRAAARAARVWSAAGENASHVATAISSFTKPSLIFLTPMASAEAPDVHQGQFLAAEVEFDSLFGAAPGRATRLPTLVIDGRGNVVFRAAHPEMRLNNVYQRSTFCGRCHRSFAHVDRMLETPRGVLRYALRGDEQLAASTHFDFQGERWLVAVSASSDAAVRVLANEFQQIAAVVVATMVVAGLVVGAGWADERRRIQAKSEAARRAHLEQSHAELTSLNMKLELAAAEWRATVDTIDAGLILLEPNGCIQRMNRVASDMLPGDRFSWTGAPTEALAAHEPWNSAIALAKEAVETQNIAMARVHYAASGRTWDLWCRAPQGRAAVLVVARDVTSIVALQESVRHSETMAALGSVVVGVAHEVRNPLFTISSLVDAWAIQKQPRDPQPLMDALRREVGRVNALMTELLEYGRPAAAVLERHALGAILDEAIAACRAESETRSVRVRRERLCDVDVWSDARLPRVFINLITNAIQHSPAGAEVIVSAVTPPPPRTVVMTVRDSGPGFAEADIPRLFTPFFSKRKGGFGLGLAISARIVTEHRGKIAAANHPDGGAVITVSLPLTAPEHQIRVCEGADRVEEPNPAGR